MKDHPGNYNYTFEREAGVDDCAKFTICFNVDGPYVPARTSGPAEDCHPAEGGVVEDITVFHNVEGLGFPTLYFKIPETLWMALGLDNLEDLCQNHLNEEEGT